MTRPWFQGRHKGWVIFCLIAVTNKKNNLSIYSLVLQIAVRSGLRSTELRHHAISNGVVENQATRKEKLATVSVTTIMM